MTWTHFEILNHIEVRLGDHLKDSTDSVDIGICELVGQEGLQLMLFLMQRSGIGAYVGRLRLLRLPTL